jgi:CRISPR/Cas system CMR subunit Cmr4 (Cas7 group RAMP superfamily)
MHDLYYLTEGMTAETELEVIRQAGAIMVAIVTAIGAIALGILNRARQHSKNAREHAQVAAENSRVIVGEVKNSHTTNLREESDERHRELIEKLEQVIEVQAEQGEVQAEQGRAIHALDKGLGGVRDDVRELRSNVEKERARIRDLEDTRPRGSRPAPRTHRKDHT